jgi:predicted Zn finger-like uncharacterized protein
MAKMRITCPHCGYWKDVAQEVIPAGAARVTCPRCRESFALEGACGDAPGAEESFHETAGSSPDAGEQREASSLRSTEPVPPGAERQENPQVPPFESQTTAPGRLAGINELFARTWEIYKNRIGTLIALYLLAVISLLAPLGLFLGLGYLLSLGAPESKTALLAGGGMAGGIVGCVAMFWGLGALVCAVADPELGIREALEKGWERFWAFAWLYFLSGFIVIGGYLLFFIPGVIFSVWFVFAQFVVADGQARGMDALFVSREYVRDCWFDVFARLIIIWLFSVVIGWVPVVGAVLSLLAIPFTMIYTWLIYADLREVKGDTARPCGSGEKFAWLGVAALGYLLLPLLIIAIAGVSLFKLFLSP